jgi:hypothetical protein
MLLKPVGEAVGQVICHDITQIVADEFKGVRFHKGHIIKEEDIETLLSIGKEHVYVFEKKEGMLHEEEAAEILSFLAKGKNIKSGEVKEGKIELFSECEGLLKVKSEKLFALNSIDGIVIASKRGNSAVKKDDKIAGVKVVPLFIEKSLLEKARAICCAEEKLFDIIPFSRKRVGLIITGSEIYKKRIKDGFSPVIKEKLSHYD